MRKTLASPMKCWGSVHTQTPFLLKYRQGLRTQDDVLGEANIARTRDIFNNVSVTNIMSEAAFARSNSRRRTSHGNESVPSVLSSNHVLCAAKTCLDAAIELQGRRLVCPPKESSQACQGWQVYLQRHRASHTMRDCATMWHNMSKEEKQAYTPTRRVVEEGKAQRRFARPWFAEHSQSELLPAWQTQMVVLYSFRG